MAAEAGDVKGSRPRFECGAYASVQDLAAQIAESVARQLGCDEVVVTIARGERNEVGYFPKTSARDTQRGPLFEIAKGGATFRKQTWSLPFLVKDLQRARVPNDLALELAVRKVRSFGAIPLMSQGRLLGIVECHFTKSYHRWHAGELSAFEELSQSLSSLDSSGIPAPTRAEVAGAGDSRSQYSRMARYGNLIIIVTDAQFCISDVFGNAESILGVSVSEMKSNAGIWERIIDPRDQVALRRRILRLRLERDELKEEVRIVHQQTGEVRWLMLRALPQFSPAGAFLGWEGFGIDITERRQAQDALANQSARVEALFEVARTLQGQTEPALVVLRGLRALMKATGSHCGYGCFYQQDADELEVVAAHGLSEEYLDNMRDVLTGPSILRDAVANKRGLRIPNLQVDPRADIRLAKMESLASAVVMPLVADDEVFGALVLFTREVGSFSESDFELVSAAATQIALAVRQTYLFESERQHNQSLSALYRISHELTKYRTPKEIAEHAFPILRQEFTLKRGWLGVLNEQGTHLVGKAGFGHGLRRKLQEVQIELTLRHDFLDEALKNQRPVVVPAGSKMECSGLQRVVELLKLETLVIVPLLSLGQVVGVIIVEPNLPHSVWTEGRLQLLSSMANEMATVLMARNFESKMAEALKMRMAGLLASGVAHNFNNMLQAILGQVALLEMQLPKDSPVAESARMISDAAKRGATLVSQLINFATQPQGSRQIVNISKLLVDSQELYRSLLGKRIQLTLKVGKKCPDVTVDPNQIQQVVTNLLVNAKEAMGAREWGEVEVSVAHVRLRTGEVDPELPPGGYIRIDIRDNGMGMNAEQQARCFEPFFTTKNVDRGTGVGLTGSGLGLSAAYSIVKQHNGIISLQSVYGEGSTFSVYLPEHHGGTEPSNADSPIVRRRSAVKGGVLFMGLESGAQPFVSSLFESLGYRSRGVFDVVQAGDVLTRDGDKWGYLLVDADILGDDGVKNCEQLLQKFPDVCVLVMSASPFEGRGALAPNSRVAYVEKPLGVWSVESLLKRFQTGSESH